MTSTTIGRPDDIHAYIERLGYREPGILARLRAENASHPQSGLQIAPEQGAVLALLVELIGARRCLEIGTFTGYSSLAMALALPADALLLCCDVSDEYTQTARRYWAEAGVANKVELRLGPATDTLDRLLAADAADTFDLAFIDADKPGYPAYWERCLRLVRRGGLIVLDNMLFHGRAVNPGADDESGRAINAMNEQIARDDRVSFVLLGIADGMTIARRR
jgi:predicted O-methyltransferase YrrM